MTAAAVLVLPPTWATVVLLWGWRHRPAPGRVAAMVAPRRLHRSAGPSALGRWIRGSLGRPIDGTADRRVGWAMVLIALLLVVSPLVALSVGAGLLIFAPVADRRRARRSRDRVLACLPETIDLFVLAAGSGRPVPAAMAAVATRAAGPVADQLRLAVRRVELGERTADALRGLAESLGEPVGPLVAALVASDLEGTPLVPALERLAVEARLDRRRRAEEAARRVPVKLLFPLVCCTLPAFALLTVVPLLVGALGSLRL